MRLIRNKPAFLLGIVCLLAVSIFISRRFYQLAEPDDVQLVDVPALLRR